jgi:hypothetical protein
VFTLNASALSDRLPIMTAALQMLEIPEVRALVSPVSVAQYRW